MPLKQLRIGMRIHLSGMDFGCVWEITNILPPDSNGDVYLWAKTTGTGKLLTRPVKASRAYYIRADEPRLTARRAF